MWKVLAFNMIWLLCERNCDGIVVPKYLKFVCLSIRMEQLGAHWTDFHEIWHWSIFRESVVKIQVSLKSEKNNGYFTWRPKVHLWYHAEFFL
jgi:hypothetical protein